MLWAAFERWQMSGCSALVILYDELLGYVASTVAITVMVALRLDLGLYLTDFSSVQRNNSARSMGPRI